MNLRKRTAVAIFGLVAGMGLLSLSLAARAVSLSTLYSIAAVSSANVKISWIESSDNGDSSGDGSVSHYEVRYSSREIVEENFDDETVVYEYEYSAEDEDWLPLDPGDIHVVTLTGIPTTTRYIGLKACDEADNCSPISLFPLDLGAPEPIEDLAIEEELSDGFVLSFTPIDEEEYPVFSLDVRYLEGVLEMTAEEFYTATEYLLGEELPAEVATGKLTLSSLAADEDYAVAIKVVDENGASDISNVASGTTLDEVPPGLVEGLAITHADEESLTLSWTVPSDNGDSTGEKPIFSYIISYADQVMTSLEPLAPGALQTLTLTGLAGDAISVTIQACDEVPLCSEGVSVSYSPSSPELSPAEAPVVSSPLYEGDASIFGTADAPNGALVTIYLNGEPIGDTTVSGGGWEFSSLSPGLLQEDDVVSATVTIDTNQDGVINELDLSSDPSEGVILEKLIVIDSTPPGLVEITDLNFTLLEDLGGSFYDVTIDMQGTNITEPLRRMSVCVAPVRGDIPAMAEVQEFLFLPRETSAAEVWVRTVSTQLASETVRVWVQAKDLSSNVSGSSCSSRPATGEGLTIVWHSGGGKMAYYFIVSAETDEVVEVDAPSANEADLVECSDFLDNDLDGKVDYPDDPECSSSDDTSEGPFGGTATQEEEPDAQDPEEEELLPEEEEEEEIAKRPAGSSGQGEGTPPPPPTIVSLTVSDIIKKAEDLFVATVSIRGIMGETPYTVGIHVESEPFELKFRPEPGAKEWSHDIRLEFDSGDHLVYAWVEDDLGQRSANSNIARFVITPEGATLVTIEKPKDYPGQEGGLLDGFANLFSDSSDSSAEPATAVGRAVETVIDNPVVEQAALTVVPPVIATVVVANTAAATTSFSLLAYLRYLFTSPLLLIARRKRKKWGIVYNSLTKKPVDLAIVRLFSRKTNKLIKTQVTDKEGRYQFIVPKGGYYITVTKPEFVFPTSYLEFKNSDADYLDLYHGDTVNITSEGQSIALNIPLDPKEKKVESIRDLLGRQLMRRSQSFLAFSGVLLALISFLVSPVPLLLGLLVAHILLYFLFRRFSHNKRSRGWGRVYEAKTKKPVKNAIVRIFDTEFHRLLETQLSDSQGRYSFLVGRSMYYVTVEKKGFKSSTTDQIDLTRKGKENIVKMDIALKRG